MDGFVVGVDEASKHVENAEESIMAIRNIVANAKKRLREMERHVRVTYAHLIHRNSTESIVP